MPHYQIDRRSHRRCSLRKGVLRNFAKFTGKHLAQVFFCEFCEISKNTFFTEHLWATASELSRKNILTMYCSHFVVFNSLKNKKTENKCMAIF